MTNEEIAEIVEPALEGIRAVDEMDASAFVEWLGSEGASIVEFDGGSDWTLVDKDTLVDTPFIIARLRFNKDKKTDELSFVSVCAFLEDGSKIVFNDGGSGVMKQLLNYTTKHPQATGISCGKGLRKSSYTFTDPATGKESPAATFYIQ